MIQVGCCGFPRSHPVYFGQLRLVEIQQTFYKPPRAQTALRWREQEAPADFDQAYVLFNNTSMREDGFRFR